MSYKVLVKGGQGSAWEHFYQARQVARRDNRLDDDRFLSVFKNGADIFVCAKADRDYFRSVIEAETGIDSQVCTIDKAGQLKVWG